MRCHCEFRQFGFSVLCAMIAVATQTSASVAGTRRFDHVEIQSFKGGETTVVGINESGIIAGASGGFVPMNRQVFVSGSSGELTNINQLGLHNGVAIDINEAGQVAGTACQESSLGCYDTLFRYSPGLGMQELSNPFVGALTDMNNHGDLIGFQKLDTIVSTWHAFFYSDARGWQDLGTLGGLNSEARKVNDAGQVVGSSTLAPLPAPTHAFLWQDGVMTDLSTFGGPHSGAIDINNAGVVIGWAHDPDWNLRGFRYTTKDGMQPLPMPEGAIDSGALAINDAGMILLAYTMPDTTSHAALLIPDGRLVDIPLLEGFPTGSALAMNNLGHVIGACVLVNGSEEIVSAFYWSPETGTLSLDGSIISQLPWTIFTPIAINDSDEILVHTFTENGEVSALLRPALIGDFNGDRIVDIHDLLGVIGAWGICSGPGVCAADFDGDDSVDIVDLLDVVSHWGPGN